jgi:hypothetical protein
MSGLLLVYGDKSSISAINAQTARIAVWWNDAEGARLESILSVGNAINPQVQRNRRAAGAIQSDAAYAVDSRIEGLGIWRRRN